MYPSTSTSRRRYGPRRSPLRIRRAMAASPPLAAAPWLPPGEPYSPTVRGGPVAYREKAARSPLAVYHRKSLRASTSLVSHCVLRDGCVLGRHCFQASPTETAGSTGTMCSGRRPTPPSLQPSFSVFSQGLGFLQGGGVQPLGEPPVDQDRLHTSSLEALREESYAVTDEDLVHVSPAQLAPIHP